MTEPAAVALQMYSVREALAESVPATLQRLAGIGLRNLELWNIIEYNDQFRAGLADNGLTPLSAHAPILREDAEPYLDAAAALGVGTVHEAAVSEERWRTRDDIQRIAESLNALVDDATSRGLTVGYHNHSWEFANQVDGQSAYELLASLVDPAIRLEVDTYWAAVGGADVPAVLQRLGSQVAFLHIKDGPTTTDSAEGFRDRMFAQEQEPAGRGSMQFEPILAAAPAAVRVIEFDNYRGDIFDGIAESFNFLSQAEAEGRV